MKIVICTTPIRPVPTSYPPFGSLAVIQSLQAAGYSPYFLDIDGLRPRFAEVRNFLETYQPALVGISAVVSTAYAYTKKLCQTIREVCPRARIVVGGNMAASAEILLRLCQVDVCVTGEGEVPIVKLADYFRAHPPGTNFAGLKDIRGLLFLDSGGEVVFTGYENQIRPAELLDPDFTILERYSKIDNYICDPFTREEFVQDPRAREPHRQDRKMSTVVFTKGCVARCTFCHRWDKGFRQLPVEKTINRIKHLQDRYNVGFIKFGDENFGSDRRATDELIEALKPLDILWSVSGVRARTVDLGLLQRMKAAGCVALYYGIESGSQRILDVMEKNTSVEQNLRAAHWTHEAGLFTIYQFVLGMPGETEETIGETAEFVKEVTESIDERPVSRLSINYIQALPGTPVYEYARERGLIGKSLKDEERYLLRISDVNAADDRKFVNYTQYDDITVQSWKPRILMAATAHYYRRHGLVSRLSTWRIALSFAALFLPRSWRHLLSGSATTTATRNSNAYATGGYFNIGDLLFDYHPVLYRIHRPLLFAYLCFRAVRERAFDRVLEFLSVKSGLRRRPAHVDYRSLRKVVKEIAPAPLSTTAISMRPIREGR